MSLEHVKTWDDNSKSWRPITIDQAVKKYTHKVSSGTGIFVCSICCQAVTLAAVSSSKQKAHFRHSRTSEEVEKWCEDRSRQYACDEIETKLQFRNLPLKLICGPDNKRFRFELGFFKKDQQYCERIIISNSQGVHKNYNFDRILANDSGFEYLNVGRIPSEEYTIEYIGQSPDFNKYYPEKVTGLDREGTLFAKSSGKILRHLSKARLNENYFLLIRKDRTKFLFSLFSKIDLSGVKQIKKDGLHFKYISELKEGSEPWLLYQVKAYELTKTSTLFFLRLGVQLLDFKQQIILLGPRMITNECVIRTYSDYAYMCANSSSPEIIGFADHEKRKVKITKAGSIWKLKITDVERWVSFSRSGEYQQFYLEKSNDAVPLRIADVNKVTIKDIENSELTENLYTKLPLDKTLVVTSSWDGFIEVLFNGNLIAKENIFANSEVRLRNLQLNSIIKIYIGNDLFKSIEFKKNHNKNKEDSCLADLLEDRALSRQKLPLSMLTAKGMGSLSENEVTKLRALILSGKLSKRVLNYLECKRGL